MTILNPLVAHINQTRIDIAALQSEIAQLQNELGKKEAMLSAFEISAKLFDGASSKFAKNSSLPEKKTRNRLPNLEWQRVFDDLYSKCNNNFGYEDILNSAAELNIEVNRDSLRTKLMNYKNKGAVGNIEAGRFEITNEGLSYFNIGTISPQKIEAPNAQAPEPQDVSLTVL
jgi:hypothetical protein